MYHDRTAWRCAFFMGKNMEAAKDIHKEMLPIWAFASIFFAHKKTHNAKLFYCDTCIQGRRHLLTAATSVQSCAYRSLCVTIKLDSAAI
jgi:hypothetical protein